jgi:hypothetical protein
MAKIKDQIRAAFKVTARRGKAWPLPKQLATLTRRLSSMKITFSQDQKRIGKVKDPKARAKAKLALQIKKEGIETLVNRIQQLKLRIKQHRMAQASVLATDPGIGDKLKKHARYYYLKRKSLVKELTPQEKSEYDKLDHWMGTDDAKIPKPEAAAN